MKSKKTKVTFKNHCSNSSKSDFRNCLKGLQFSSSSSTLLGEISGREILAIFANFWLIPVIYLAKQINFFIHENFVFIIIIIIIIIIITIICGPLYAYFNSTKVCSVVGEAV